MKFPSAFDDQSLLTYEVSDENSGNCRRERNSCELYPWVLHGLV